MTYLNDKDLFKQIRKHSIENVKNDTIEEHFPFFCLKVFFNDLSEDDIESIVYKLDQNDESVDGFYIDEDNKELIFIQFKSSKSKESMKPLKKEWLSYLYDIENKLLNHDYIENHTNERIRDIATDYAVYKNKYKFKSRFLFFHLGYNPNSDIIKSYTNFEYYGFEDIKDEFQEYISKLDRTEPNHIEIKLKHQNIEEKIGKHRTLISLITGDEIIKLRKHYKYKLFDKNLRFSLGKNKINEQIVQTCLGEKENFYYYNNGITITSKGYKYKKNSNSVRIDFPQIINGAQTVNSIYSAYKKRENRLTRETGEKSSAKVDKEFSKINIMFRIIQDEDNNVDFETNVIKFNNTQNAIQQRDFYANAKEQIDLQRKFSKFGYFYEIKRGDRDYIKKKGVLHNILELNLSDFKFKDEKIDIQKMAGIWMAYYVQDPSLKSVGKESIFGKGDNYSLLFLSQEFDDKLVKEMILAYNIFDIIEKETKIYRGSNSILYLLSTDLSKNDKLFSKAKKMIQNSLLFNAMVKKRFNDLFNISEDERKQVIKIIRAFQPFSSGKYIVTAISKLILDRCNYLESILEHDLYFNKDFIKNNAIKNWLPYILSKLIIPHYNEFSEKRPSINYYFNNPKTYIDIMGKFNALALEENKEYDELFKLNMN